MVGDTSVSDCHSAHSVHIWGVKCIVKITYFSNFCIFGDKKDISIALVMLSVFLYAVKKLFFLTWSTTKDTESKTITILMSFVYYLHMLSKYHSNFKQSYNITFLFTLFEPFCVRIVSYLARMIWNMLLSVCRFICLFVCFSVLKPCQYLVCIILGSSTLTSLTFVGPL